jgi:hypothetical protein
MQKVFIECGMDHVFYDMTITNTWINNFPNFLMDNAYRKWSSNALSKSSLLNYNLIKNRPHLEDYLLCNVDFYAASLKFKARSNTLPVNGRTHVWNVDKNSICTLCNHETEDLKHFMFVCNALQNVRVAEYRNLENQLSINNLDYIWQLFISSDIKVKMCFMLGISKDYFLDISSFDVDVDCMLNIFDSTCKSFLKKAWTLRNVIIASSN